MKQINVPLDEVREIKFSINAMVELEDRFNKSIPQIFELGVPGIRHIRAMLMIGLKHGGMKILGKTVEDQELFIGDMLQEHWLGEGRTMKELMDDYVRVALEEAGLFRTEAEAKENPPDQGTDA